MSSDAQIHEHDNLEWILSFIFRVLKNTNNEKIKISL